MPLNPSQIEAVKSCGFPLIIAGPGSGKTRVITEKILHLIDQGIPPNQVLALTFSDKAAAGVSDRIEEKRPHPGLAGKDETGPLHYFDMVGVILHPARHRDRVMFYQVLVFIALIIEK